jgi:predicted ATPase
MRIKSIKVDNFKSLVNFELPLAKFSCLVGLNGSGKSTVLQFFDFLSQQVRGDLSGWLKKRQWEASDLSSKLKKGQRNIKFEVSLIHDSDVEIKWSASFNRQTLQCTTEHVEWNKITLLKVEHGSYAVFNLPTIAEASSDSKSKFKKDGVIAEIEVQTRLVGKIAFEYQGSVMSQIKESQLPKELRELKKFFVNLHALDLLAPELIRQRTRDADSSIGLGGEKLSAFLYVIGEEKRDSIQSKLSKIYPQFKHIDISSLRSGLKRLAIQEQFENTTIKSESRHISDGFLRMLAVFAQLSKEQSFLLIDEIENGVNPELIEFLIDELVGATPQVLITTHSPMVLNYMEDEVAIEGVIYIYKAKDGITKATRLFDISGMRDKLTVMGAGEVYEDTLLTQLNEKLQTGAPPTQLNEEITRSL